MKDAAAFALAVAQVGALVGLLELVVGWWRVRRALDDLHEVLVRGGSLGAPGGGEGGELPFE